MAGGFALQSFRLNHQFRQTISCIHKRMNELFDVVALLGGFLCELDSHADFRVHDANHTFDPQFDLRHLHGQNDPGPNRKW